MDDFSSAAGLPASEAVATTAMPTFVEPVENGFAAMGLAPALLQALTGLEYTTPTPVQREAIPLAMLTGPRDGGVAASHDLMVSSRTGSGKTAAFLLPVLDRLIRQRAEEEAAEAAAHAERMAQALARGEQPPRKPRRRNPMDVRRFQPATPGALVLCPTRELAQQVAEEAIELLRQVAGVRVACVVGGMPYPVQVQRLQNARLVVATPGRLLDLHRGGQIRFEQLKALVLDEADRMLDLGFADDLAEIHALCAGREQTLMFSATFAPHVEQLAARVMPVAGGRVRRLQIDSQHQQHSEIEESLLWADDLAHKRRLLDHWLRDASIDQAIVFASTQVECDALADDLQQEGFAAVGLHGALSQGLRNRRLQAFRRGQVRILVATDVAARGIDVPTITHVINFGLPMKAEDYTHRIGRTGRAGRAGMAISLAEPRDLRRVRAIEAHTRRRLKIATVPGLEGRFGAPPAESEVRKRKGPPRRREDGQGYGRANFPSSGRGPGRSGGDRARSGPSGAPGHGSAAARAGRDEGQRSSGAVAPSRPRQEYRSGARPAPQRRRTG